MCEIGFGIDGGGTRSRLCLFRLEDGREISRFTGGSTNMYSVGQDEAMRNIEQLLRSSGISLEKLKAGCLGSAGLSRPAEKEAFSAFFRRLLPQCSMYLCNDGETLLVGALEATEGYCLIAGTGSLALARNREGHTARAGGLGYMLGDEGSALWIAWQAIRRAIRSREGRDLETSLLPDLVKHFSLSCPEDFVALLHHHFEKALIATAAGLVLDRAQDDPLAADIARAAINELVQLLGSVMRQMPLSPPCAALAGGVMEHNAWLRSRLIDRLALDYPGLKVVLGPGDAVRGACMLARAAWRT